MSLTCVKSHVRTFGEKDKSRSVETIYSNLRWFRLLQTLVLKFFFMVLKHMNCLLNVIIENFLKSHGRTFGKKAESRSVETIYTDLRCFRLLQTLVLKFFMVLKHMNCLLNVIIQHFLKSHGRT